MRSWLITGGCGFIGVNLVKVLKERGDYIRILDNLSIGGREDLSAVTNFKEVSSPGRPSGVIVELMVGDVTDSKAALSSVNGIDTVVHLAAHTGVVPSLENPRFDCEQNVFGTLNMLEASRKSGVDSFVFASSGAPLGDQDMPLDEQKVPRPLSPYGASKLAGEAYCSAYHGSFDLNTVVLRFSNAYGPYSFKKGSVIAEHLRRILFSKPLVVYGDGNQTRDFIHVRDLCQAMVKAGEGSQGGEVFQIATGVETSVNDLVSIIINLAGKDLAEKIEVNHKPVRKGEVLRSVSDITKAQRLLGYKSEVDIEEGIEETWRWFRSTGK